MSPIKVLYCNGKNVGGALSRADQHPRLPDADDYAFAIGRLMGAPLDADEVPDYLSGPLPETLPYADGIAAAKQALCDSFPMRCGPTEWTKPC